MIYLNLNIVSRLKSLRFLLSSNCLPQNVDLGLIFYRILRIVNNQDAKLYQVSSFVQLQNTIFIMNFDLWYAVIAVKFSDHSSNTKGLRFALCCLPPKTFHQTNYFAIVRYIWVCKGLNLPKYTSLPHLWHSVIATLLINRPQVLTSQAAVKTTKRKVNLPVTSHQGSSKILFVSGGEGEVFYWSYLVSRTEWTKVKKILHHLK